jgi:hypothetical protein
MNFSNLKNYEEIWKSIQGYEGSHEISNMGRIRSLDRVDCSGRNLKGRELTPFLNKKIGYLQISIKKDGMTKLHRIHRLVAEAFVENPENKSQVNHIDGNKLNNAAFNLEWTTPYENTNHAIDIGLKPSLKGSNGIGSKLTGKQVIEIYKRANDGENQRLLGEEFGVNQRTISAIKHGISWGWLTNDSKK